MGYELSIQREDEENKITVEEWKNYLNSDSEFNSIEDYSATLGDGKVLTVSTPNAGLWKAAQGEVPFTFSENYGWISVKNPENWIIEKMISIADKLDAVVLGEEGEKYDKKYLEENSGIEDIDMTKYKNIKIKPFDPNKKWWQFWK